MVITSVGDEITFISVGDEIGDLQKKKTYDAPWYPDDRI